MIRKKRAVKLNPGTLTSEEMEYGRRIGQMRQKSSRAAGIPDQTFKAGASASSDEVGGQAEVFSAKMSHEETGETYEIAEVDTFHSKPDVGGVNIRYNGKLTFPMILKYKDHADIPMISSCGNPAPPDFAEVGWIDPGQMREIYATIMETLSDYPEAQEAINNLLKPYYLKSHEEFAVPRNWLNYMNSLNRKFKP